MKQRYRISPNGRGPEPTDAELARYRDPERLRYNYQRALGLIHKRPIYKDPKAFLALLLILLVVWLVVDADRKEKEPPEPQSQQEAPR